MQHIGAATSTTKVYRSQQFWLQHKELDNLLTKVSTSRSAELRPLDSSEDLKLWALEMWLHGLSICLHQTAMDCATKENKLEQMSDSRKQCRTAADQIIRITRSIAHMETKKVGSLVNRVCHTADIFSDGSFYSLVRLHGGDRLDSGSHQRSKSSY